ncbi:hypothetical protein J4219_08925 [Candidatus Woesearchaeota archaeon]|nr:hypothetical protein [Candidatus Woesearchaeota archaeon]
MAKKAMKNEAFEESLLADLNKQEIIESPKIKAVKASVKSSSDGPDLHHNPLVLALIAVLAIGGLVVLGYGANVVGSAVYESRTVCCTGEAWRFGSSGLIQLGAQTYDSVCSGWENTRQCCLRVAGSKNQRYICGKDGSCVPPQVSYPTAPPVGGFSVCCSTSSWQHSPTGYAQGTAMTRTEYCNSFETMNQCCIRGAASRSSLPFKILGSRMGPCSVSSPMKSYPIWVQPISGVGPYPT